MIKKEGGSVSNSQLCAKRGALNPKVNKRKANINDKRRKIARFQLKKLQRQPNEVFHPSQVVERN